MKIYQSNILNNYSNLTYAFTTRDGGVSKKPYLSFNLAYHVEDNVKDVDLNHESLASILNYNKRTLVHMKQIHSDIVHIVKGNDNFDNPPICDALITDKKNIPLMVMVADCSPILFYDAKKEVIAVAHVGRQGAFKNIVQNVINTFVKTYGSDAKDIYATVGTSIGACCYEVGSEIYEEAKALGLEYAMQNRNANFYLDISKILKAQLLASEVKEENIEFSDECSCCNNDTFFSYRADEITGRFAGILMIRE